MRRRTRRALAVVATCATILSVPGSATAQLSVEAEHDREQWRVASATWSRPKGDERIFYSLSIEEIQPGWPDGRPRYFTYFYVTTCEVNAEGKPRGTCVGSFEYGAKVVSFEMDPALMSARAVLRLEGERADVTWTGGLPVLGHPVGAHANQAFYPPEYGWVEVEASVMAARDASAGGNVFGRSFGDEDLEEAWVYHYVAAESSASAYLYLGGSNPTPPT